MPELKIKHIARLLPLTFFIHPLEELFGGVGLLEWFSTLFRADLSFGDFIIINTIGFFIMIMVAISHTFGKGNTTVNVALSMLLFLNGIIHILINMFTLFYSPGSISGLLLYIPLGIVVYKKIFPQMTYQKK